MIRLEHVTKRFDSLEVFRDLSLHVADNQIVGVVGPSGSGKTTLLKLVAGMVQADEGTIAVDPGAIGYVFQEPRLLPWRTSLDNVAATLRARGWEKTEARERAAAWIERVGLKGFEDYHPAELSGGMAQRVSIARAFAVDPRVLLLDEPFSNVDLALKDSLMEILQRIIREGQTTVMYVTHDLTEALRLADRIVEITPERRLRELDLSDRRAVAAEWLSASLGKL
ncbi:MAG: ATP-binding cassette domain-containing protein [Actinobacteria bacterium]|nr:ATP-binding cassette domain-containing protein [Actinomycetota bacterium]